MRYLGTILLLTLVGAVQGQYEVPPPQHVYGRERISLNGHWQYFVDRYEAFFYDFWRTPFDSSTLGKRDFAALDARPTDQQDRLEYGFDGADSLRVPGDWNSQRERLFYYEGSVWYRKRLSLPDPLPGRRQLLYFGAANYRADVYVNGVKAGVHTGGFLPFAFEVSQLLRPGDNSIVVRIDNQRSAQAVPADVTDWWNYGGITRDVFLLPVADNYLEAYQLQLHTHRPDLLQGFVTWSAAQADSCRIRCPALGLDITVLSGGSKRVSFEHTLNEQPRYWQPSDPYLYTFELITAGDTLYERIGLRTIRTQGDQLLLNGQPIFLRGICVHEENSERGGRASTRADALRILSAARELNANFLRLAHYPHNEYMPHLADSLGLLLWEEIPVYWTIDWTNPATYALAQQQLTDLIDRDRNRASVIIWSLANETPPTAARLTFLTNLAAVARQADSSRLVSAALFKESLGGTRYTISDPFSAYTDLVSFNQYLGWYEGLPDILDSAQFVFADAKPVFVSEFGAGAKAGLRGDSLTRWSEDYQDYLYRNTLQLLDRMPHLAGFSPWILYDFRSPRRQLPGIQDGWNRKGLISATGERKLAFYRLQAYYARLAAQGR